MINEIIDLFFDVYSIYKKNDWYWVINPNTNELIVCVGNTGYTFYNEKAWDDFSKYYPIENLTDNISQWVVNKLKVPKSIHCYPVNITGVYNWWDDFNESEIIDVITNGELVFI